MKKVITLGTIAALAFMTTTSSALAFFNSDMVMNHNEGFSGSLVSADANTGLNEATGARGGDGGRGGDVERSEDDNVGGAGGNGGSADAPASGGLVTTGSADAEAGAMHAVNSNDTRINREDCGCEGSVMVMSMNRGAAMSGTFADANTGLNRATGAEGGEGGNAGEVEESEDDNVSGRGGHGGDAGEGGTVVTGSALSRAGSIHLLNSNITRINRTAAEYDD